MMNVLDSSAVPPAIPVSCWACSVSHAESALFCPHCGKIQPPIGGNFFSVFGLVPHLNLDLGMLEHEFHKLSRKLHPDRFGRATASEREWSLAGTALLNDAYRTLKYPLHRTEYLLKLHGAEIGEEHAGKGRMDPSRVPADLLEEVFELNMQLEEMRMARKMGEHDADLEQSLADAKKKFDSLLDDVDQDLRAQWTEWDDGEQAARAAAQTTMVALLDRRRYLNNLVRDVTETLGA
ncbi:MAG TPA: Fe-S protein assembly co-chaperone HscB [Terracidiphilus sp.]|jgi:molecular chaperone HscB|nr:Fe-S protein assembly co-chaperone HscB [Terracidiphilus sp.]